MIKGTGPGRGMPWWRSGRVLLLWHKPGVVGQESSASRPREGRTIAKIKRVEH